jgi:8-oxo-dGTP diphosphatase
MTPEETAAGRPVRAAGGVVWRRRGGTVEVAVVHRPRYDDWSLPKGKLDPGEHPLTAAVREVAEEADVRGVPQVRLPSVRYLMRNGVPKLVEFWSMRMAETGGFQPGTEVDDVRWLPPDEAAGLVSYPHDVRVLRDFAALPPVTAVLGVVRHAYAGRRGTWSGPDEARPLDSDGWAQARTLAGLLALIRPVRLLSAAPRRCVQTLQPLADLLDRRIEVDSVFDEPRPGQAAAERDLAAADRLLAVAAADTSAVVCGQGTVIPPVLAQLDRVSGVRAGLGTAAGRDDTAQPRGAAAAGPPPRPARPRSAEEFQTRHGDGWLLAFAGDRLVAVSRLDGTDGLAGGSP